MTLDSVSKVKTLTLPKNPLYLYNWFDFKGYEKQLVYGQLVGMDKSEKIKNVTVPLL